MTTQQDQIYSDCLCAMKDGAILLHPLDAEEDKCLYLKFQNSYKENVPPGVWKRLTKHPQIKKEHSKKWEIWKYLFEGDYSA